MSSSPKDVAIHVELCRIRFGTLKEGETYFIFTDPNCAECSRADIARRNNMVLPEEPPSPVAIVADRDVKALERAQKSYGDSWKRRGGVGAFMMLARKWDRLENQLSTSRSSKKGQTAVQWDIFDHIIIDERAEGIIDDIRDLRRYLILVEAEMLRRGVAAAKTKSRDEQ